MGFIGEKEISKKYNKNSIIEAIQRFYTENNRIPQAKDFSKTEGKYPGFATVIRYFGTWNEGIKAAGFNRYERNWNKETIIETIQRFYKENNKIPKRRDFNKTQGKYLDESTVRKYFGSWNEGITAAGFKPNCRNWNKESIIQSIQDFYKENNRIPQFRDFTNTKGKYPGGTTVQISFNSWNNAIEAAGFESNISMYGTQIKASDGHLYRSRYEAEFVNKYLFNQYEYEIEPKYPNPYSRYYDWYIPKLDLYIELDGESRPEVTKEKIEINKLLNRNLLVIKTKDINKYSSLGEMT